jgi:hypothetical protein
MNRLEAWGLALGVAAGVAIAYVDSRPGWDDTGVTAAAILVSSATVAVMAARRPWLTALAVGVWIPLVGILSTRNYGSLLALAIAFAGACAGTLIGKMLRAR